MKVRTDNLTATASRYYEPTLPYHNFSHALASLNYAKQLARAAKSPLNLDVIHYALLFHDAGYSHDHAKEGFDSKEAYAASIAEKELRLAEIDEPTVRLVKQAILATHRDGVCLSAEDQIVRLADIGNVAGDYKTFMIENRKVKAEHEYLSGQRIDWPQWRQKTALTLEAYLSPETDWNRDFVGRARKNLARYLA